MPPPQPAGEAVIVIDLRPGDADSLRASRAAFLDDLDRIQGVAPRRDPDLDAALAGEAVDLDAVKLRAALDEARAGFGDLDCARAATAATTAIDLAAGRQAAGLDDGTALRAAYAFVLLCADQAGDRQRAQTAADRLRTLGVAKGEEAGISAATWARFPEIDASTDRDIVAVEIASDAVGAAVWIDHVAAGTTPMTAHLPAGEHVIAVGTGPVRGATRVTVAGKPVKVTVPATSQASTYSAIAQVVHAWRDGVSTPTAGALGTILDTVGVRFALILAGDRGVGVWARGPGEKRPRKVDDARRDEPMAVGALIVDRVAAWDGRAPDPDQPLLREGDVPRVGDRDKGPPEKWWVYAAIVGAVAVGTGILYLQDSAENRQRIEIRFP